MENSSITKRKKYAIFGDGGFSREIKSLLRTTYPDIDFDFFVISNDDDYNPLIHGDPIIAIGSSKVRKKIVSFLENKFPNLLFPTIIHPTTFIGENVKIGKGSIITQNSVLTSNIELGDFCHLNLGTTIGHDTIIQDYFTSAPGVNISGNCKINEHVYLGTNSCVIENLSISSNIILGAGSVVTKNLTEPGTYVGVPAKIMKRG